MNGPAPKPTSLKQLFGNPGQRKLNNEEPEPVQELYPQPLDWMSEPAKAIWRELAQDLVILRLLTRIDKTAFARYCTFLHLWIVAKNWIETHGTTYPVQRQVAVVDERGIPVFNAEGQPVLRTEVTGIKTWPQFNQCIRLSSELRNLEHEFGLTPSARTRIRIASDGSIGREPTEAGKSRPFEYKTR